MDPEKVKTLPRPETPRARLAWALGVIRESFIAREEHFKFRDAWNEQFVQNTVTYDNFGVPTKHKNIYGALHAEYIFYVMGVIESFEGVVSAAWEFTQQEPSNYERILKILIDPGKYRHDIKKRFSERLTKDEICGFIGMPILDTFNSRTKELISNYLTLAFERFSICGKMAQETWTAFKPVRNVYAHNFRFIFFDGTRPVEKPEKDQWVIGHLDKGSNLIGGSFLVGATQRIALGELGLVLSRISRWVCENIQDGILCEGKPILPKNVPYLTQKESIAYQKLWNSLGYKIGSPKPVEHQELNLGKQMLLYDKLQQTFANWGHTLRTVDQHGVIEPYGQRFRTKREELRDKRRPKKARAKR